MAPYKKMQHHPYVAQHTVKRLLNWPVSDVSALTATSSNTHSPCNCFFPPLISPIPSSSYHLPLSSQFPHSRLFNAPSSPAQTNSIASRPSRHKQLSGTNGRSALCLPGATATPISLRANYPVALPCGIG